MKQKKLKRDETTTEVGALTAAKEKLEGEITTLAKDLEEHAAAQAALAKAMKEASNLSFKSIVWVAIRSVAIPFWVSAIP